MYVSTIILNVKLKVNTFLMKAKLLSYDQGSVHSYSLRSYRFLDVIPDHSLSFPKALTILFTYS